MPAPTKPRRARSRAPTVPTAPATPTFYRPDAYQHDEGVGYLMRHILNGLAAEVEREFEPSGLTNAQWVPLFKLHMGSASTVAELARECQLDAGGMTRLLDRLEAKGLLRRERSSEDRRVVNLELTADGRAAAEKVPAALCGVLNAHLRGFTEKEWLTLRALLGRMLDNARAIQAERGAQA